MLKKFELCKYNELRVLFYIQSVRVQAHCGVVDRVARGITPMFLGKQT